MRHLRRAATAPRRYRRRIEVIRRRRIAFEHIDFEAVRLHRQRAGETGDAGADDDDLRHCDQRRPRISRPGSAPVGSSCSSVSSPLTNVAR